MFQPFSDNSLNRISAFDLSKNSSKHLYLPHYQPKINKKIDLLSDSNTINWLKKRFLKKAHSKYVLLPEEFIDNKNLNKIFGFFANTNKNSNKMQLSFTNLQKIFEFCHIKLNFSELLLIFGYKAYLTENSKENIAALTIKEFKKLFLSEKADKIFMKTVKKLREIEKNEENSVFLPGSLKEVVEFVIYRLKRERILNKFDKSTLTMKIDHLSELFKMKEMKILNKHTNPKENIRENSSFSLKNATFGLNRRIYEENDDFDFDEEFGILKLKKELESEKNTIKNSIKNSLKNSLKNTIKNTIKTMKFPNLIEKAEEKSFSKTFSIKKNLKTNKTMGKIMDFNINSARHSYEIHKTLSLLQNPDKKASILF